MAKAFIRSVRAGQRKAAIADLGSLTQREIRAAMDRRVKPELLKDHRAVVKDWKSDVDFAARTYVRRDSIGVYVYPVGDDKQVWHYVNEGTRPHTIPAVVGKLMVFKAGGTYVPKTRAKPARTVAGGGVVQGGATVFTTRRRAFTHPGNEPREFTKEIAEEYDKAFRRETENAFRRALRRATAGA